MPVPVLAGLIAAVSLALLGLLVIILYRVGIRLQRELDDEKDA